MLKPGLSLGQQQDEQEAEILRVAIDGRPIKAQLQTTVH